MNSLTCQSCKKTYSTKKYLTSHIEVCKVKIQEENIANKIKIKSLEEEVEKLKTEHESHKDHTDKKKLTTNTCANYLIINTTGDIEDVFKFVDTLNFLSFNLNVGELVNPTLLSTSTNKQFMFSIEKNKTK